MLDGLSDMAPDFLSGNAFSRLAMYHFRLGSTDSKYYRKLIRACPLGDCYQTEMQAGLSCQG